ncbi:hypothetical protein [Yinghuangia sp. ASG 101]|nr:hypothetical protein [Yinghuangia sp. ASG 101]
MPPRDQLAVKGHLSCLLPEFPAQTVANARMDRMETSAPGAYLA